MKPILHIFAKDVRRFWPEILVSLAILAALVYVYPRQWPEVVNLPLNQRYQNMHEYANLLIALAAVSWCLLIARLIHAEALVGDRQYWLTRPYSWPSLLAAKLIFLVVFLYLPLALTQALILAASGFNPLVLLPGLFYNLLLLTGVFVLPLVAIATVTSDFFRMALTLLGVLAGMVTYIVLNQHISLDDALSPALLLPSINQLSTALLLGCFSVAAILLQYARRRTWATLLLLLCVPAVLAAGVLLKPLTARFDQGRMDRAFPPLAAGELAPLQITIPPNSFSGVSRWTTASDMANVYIRLAISGIPENKGVLIDTPARITLVAPDGFQWSGEVFEWSWGNKEFASAFKRSAVDLNMPVSAYTRLQSNPVTLRFSLPLTLLDAQKTTRVPISTQRFAIPGQGDCQAETFGPGQKFGGKAFFNCRSAFHQPPITQISADWSDAPCPAAQTELDYVGGPDWMGLSDSEPAEFGIDPMKFSYIGLGTSYREHKGKHLCSGHSFTLTQYQPERRMQATLTVANVQLPALR
jgi:hypothetical protein